MTKLRAGGRFDYKFYSRARLHEFLRSWQGISFLTIALIAIGALAALAILFEEKRNLYLAEAFVFLALASCLPLIVLQQSRRAWNQQPAFSGRIEYLTDAEGIEQVTEARAEKAAWSDFKRIRERKDYFALDFGAQRRAFIPKAFFATETDLGLFRSLAREAGVRL